MATYTPLGVWGLTTINPSPIEHIPHKLPCLEGALVYTSQKEALHWQRHWLARKGRMGAWGSLNARKAGKRVGLTAWTWTSQYVELHDLSYELSTGWVIYARACRSARS